MGVKHVFSPAIPKSIQANLFKRYYTCEAIKEKRSELPTPQ